MGSADGQRRAFLRREWLHLSQATGDPGRLGLERVLGRRRGWPRVEGQPEGGGPEESPGPRAPRLPALQTRKWAQRDAAAGAPVAASRLGFGLEFGSDFWVIVVDIESSSWDISSTYFGAAPLLVFVSPSKDGNLILHM